ncbi:MAG: hypothetical protein ABI039_07680 [Vicinamibacterales bacterium]
MNDQPPTSSAPKGRRYADVVVVIMCMIAGGFVGSKYYRDLYAAGGKPWYYQVDFGPAVMWTCGHGFVLPDDRVIAPLGRFLRQEVDQFSCSELPPDPPVRPVVGAQPWLMWSHLLRSAAVVWSFSGIAWSRLAPLAGVFFGATVAIAFVLLRLVSGRVLATVGAAFVLTSPLFLVELPQFRDFSKVPFMLGLAWLMAQLLMPAISSRRLLIVSAAYGAVLGLAIGFRNDVLITIPPFMLLLLLARLSAPTHQWRQRSVALLTAMAGFAILASPVLRVYSNGGGASMSHAALLGMMRPIDSVLGMSNGGLYEIGYGLDDSYAAAVVSGYESRAEGVARAIAGHSREYDAAAGRYVGALVATLPGDALTRGYAAIDRVVALPSSVAETQAISYIEALRPFYAVRSRTLITLWWIWLPAVVAAILVVSLRDLRLALLLGVLVVYFSAYPAIQFNNRHILHLSLIPIGALSYLVQAGLSRQWGRQWRNAFIVAGVGTALVVVPLLLLRKVQDRQVKTLIQSYLSAPADAVEFTDRPLANGRVALDFDFPSQRGPLPDGSVATDYLVADFDASGCNASAVDLTLRYDRSNASIDFTRRFTVSLPRTSGTTRVTLATYSYAVRAASSGEPVWYRPKGYEMPAAQRQCLAKVSRLREPSQFPVLLNTTLPSDWERLPLHLTISRWEDRPASTSPAVYLSPPDLFLATASTPTGGALGPSDLAETASNVTMTADGRLSVDGVGGIGGSRADAHLARFQAQPLTHGRRLVVEGQLRQGGVSAGWMSGGVWVSRLDITEPGPFVAAFEITVDGNYSFVIANNLNGSSLRNVFELTRLVWSP